MDRLSDEILSKLEDKVCKSLKYQGHRGWDTPSGSLMDWEINRFAEWLVEKYTKENP